MAGLPEVPWPNAVDLADLDLEISGHMRHQVGYIGPRKLRLQDFNLWEAPGYELPNIGDWCSSFHAPKAWALLVAIQPVGGPSQTEWMCPCSQRFQMAPSKK